MLTEQPETILKKSFYDTDDVIVTYEFVAMTKKVQNIFEFSISSTCNNFIACIHPTVYNLRPLPIEK